MKTQPIVEIFVDDDSQFYENQYHEIILGIQRIRTIKAFTQAVCHEYIHFVIHMLESYEVSKKYDSIPEEWVLEGEIGCE